MRMPPPACIHLPPVYVTMQNSCEHLFWGVETGGQTESRADSGASRKHDVSGASLGDETKIGSLTCCGSHFV